MSFFKDPVLTSIAHAYFDRENVLIAYPTGPHPDGTQVRFLSSPRIPPQFMHNRPTRRPAIFDGKTKPLQNKTSFSQPMGIKHTG